MSDISAIPTAALITELLDRRAVHQASSARISIALGEGNDFQLSDARLVLEVADAIAEETHLADPFLLLERNRQGHTIAPRKLLHWWLRTQAGWSFERIALHCERDHAAIMHSVTCVAGQLDFFLPLVTRVRARLTLAKIAIA
ncbi:MAG: hypothetical protein WCK77_24260 [Verrucomicrobiota bacterium]